ncbi:MAG: aminotransferase class I/II-fold pyridoxal phosphate-dependent enzyme [Cytophagaceae bacterium]|nr:aminotransferase class I/II-fold pyridoxal phosphate-dependent enzyme [Cytophagaceae bacterium]
MKKHLSRRHWLKSGAMLAAGATIADFWKPAEAAEIGLPNLAGMPIKARLNLNENPHGPAASARKAIAEAIPTGFMYQREAIVTFKKMIARENGLSEDCILLGAGSGELLMATALNYTLKGGAGSNIVGGDPTYMQLLRTATALGVGFEKVPLTTDFDYDFEKMASRINDKTSLVYVCNPNNPTGVLSPAEKLRPFCEEVSRKKPIFIDEAYMDYATDPKASSMMPLIAKGANVIITRTFSKVHGFAGLRIGYLVAQPEMVREINKFCTGGGSISATSMKGAIASYLDTEFVNYSIAKNAEAKAFLYKLLKEKGYSPLPSSTNFVLFPLKTDGKKFVEEMAKQGVAIRSWEFAGQQWCRVSMGTMDEMKVFGAAFQVLA